MNKLTPFQKYLYESIAGPASGIRMYHKPIHGAPSIGSNPTPTNKPVVGPEVEVNPHPWIPDAFDDDMQQSALDLWEWMYENIDLPFPMSWDVVFELLMAGGEWDAFDADGDGDIDMDDLMEVFFEQWLHNPDGSINVENMWTAFEYMLGFIHDWGDASLGGKLADFPFREQLANGLPLIGGGVFGAILDALEELQEILDGDGDGVSDTEDANTLLTLILALLEAINQQQAG